MSWMCAFRGPMVHMSPSRRTRTAIARGSARARVDRTGRPIRLSYYVTRVPTVCLAGGNAAEARRGPLIYLERALRRLRSEDRSLRLVWGVRSTFLNGGPCERIARS